MESMFTTLVGRYGPPTNAVSMAPAELDALAGRLPPELLAFWREYGLGTWLEGKFQFCQPRDYVDLVEQIFTGDPDLHPSATHLVGFSAMGQLLLWNEQHKRVEVDLPWLVARVDALDAREPGDPVHFPITTPLSRLDREGSFDVFEQDDVADPLFARARARLGPPDLGQCYGFVPMLAPGGSAKLDRIERLDAAVHFSLLAGAGPCRLMVVQTLGGNETFLRYLGSAGR